MSKQDRIDQWKMTIDTVTSTSIALFGPLSGKQINWKPSPIQWSIGQIYDHIIAVNQSYFPIIDQIKSGSYSIPWYGRTGIVPILMGKMILKYVRPEEKKKIATMSIWEPQQSQLPGNIIHIFETQQMQLKQVIQSSIELLEQNKMISSPANHRIVYPLETAFEIIVNHEQRHLAQAEKVFAQQKD